MESINEEILALDLLPIMAWEASNQRKRIPIDIQVAMKLSSPVLRVPQEIYEKQMQKHGWLRECYENLDVLLERWEILVPVEQKLWLILQHVELSLEKRSIPLLTVIGIDRNSSVNLVSMHKRKENYVLRMMNDDRAIIRGS